MDFENLDPNLREKALACESAEELIKLAEEAGIELNDEQLAAVAGGSDVWSCSTNERAW